MGDLWDDVVVPGDRSKPLYPDPDPEGTARMWERWRADRAARRAALAKAQGADNDEEFAPVVTLEAEEFDEPVSALASIISTAHKAGWSIVSIAHSQAFEKGKPFKTGDKAGQLRPDRELECQWVHLERGKQRAVVYYDLVNGITRSATTLRRINGVRYSDSEFKAKLKEQP